MTLRININTFGTFEQMILSSSLYVTYDLPVPLVNACYSTHCALLSCKVFLFVFFRRKLLRERKELLGETGVTHRLEEKLFKRLGKS